MPSMVRFAKCRRIGHCIALSVAVTVIQIPCLAGPRIAGGSTYLAKSDLGEHPLPQLRKSMGCVYRAVFLQLRSTYTEGITCRHARIVPYSAF